MFLERQPNSTKNKNFRIRSRVKSLLWPFLWGRGNPTSLGVSFLVRDGADVVHVVGGGLLEIT